MCKSLVKILLCIMICNVIYCVYNDICDVYKLKTR